MPLAFKNKAGNSTLFNKLNRPIIVLQTTEEQMVTDGLKAYISDCFLRHNKLHPDGLKAGNSILFNNLIKLLFETLQTQSRLLNETCLSYNL